MLGEAVAQDADGVLSVIGLSQNVLIARQLPAQSKRAMVVHLEGDDPPALGALLYVQFQVLSPTEEVLVSQTIQVPIGSPRFPGLPWTVDVPAEVIFSTTEKGPHLFRAEIGFNESRARAEVPLYVFTIDEIQVMQAKGAAAEKSSPT